MEIVSKRTQTITIILSTLLHAIILFLLLTFSYFHRDAILDPMQPTAPQETEKQATVLFKNPALQAAQPKHQPQTTQAAAPITQPTQQESVKTDTREEISPAQQAPSVSEPLETPTTLPTETIADSPTRRYRAKRRTGRKKPKTAPLNLSDITKSFIKNMYQDQAAQEGATAAQRTSHKAAQDAKDMAYAAYKRKVYKVLRESVVATCFDRSCRASIDGQEIATLSLTIRKDGSLDTVKLHYTNYSQIIDQVEQLLCEAARKAGLYPPIPHQFESDVVTLPFLVTITIRKGSYIYFI